MNLQLENQDFFIQSRKKDFESLITEEAIFSQANGMLGTRNHFIEGYGKDDVPITLINGFYNTYPFKYEENYKQFPQLGQTIVNLPDASLMEIRFNNHIVNMTSMELIDVNRKLDMSKGLVTRISTYQRKDLTRKIKEEKLVPYYTNVIVSRVTISSNLDGELSIDSTLRMPLSRNMDTIDPRLSRARKHLNLRMVDCKENYAYMHVDTIETKLNCMTAMTHDQSMNYYILDDQAHATKSIEIKADKDIIISKYQLYVTDLTSTNIDSDMEDIIKNLKSFDLYLDDEIKHKTTMWEKAYLDISDKKLSIALRYNIYQLNLNGGINSKMHIAAKGVSGDGYEGHYFWDTETYMLPFFILTQPDRARDLLKYRHDALDEARLEARNLGCQRGAKFPWRTINGRESSPFFPAGSAQIHINSDIALAYINYYYATLDDQLMIQYGAEVLLETALFYLEYGHFKGRKFHLDDVTGPDEYTALVNDNYYTNKMAQQHLFFITKYIEDHEEETKLILKRLKIKKKDLKLMDRAARSMTLLVDKNRHVIKQDSSFMSKKELDISSLSKEQFPLLTNFHPLFIYRHQVLKQADAVLAMVLCGEDDPLIYKKTFDYYLKRTTHDSSLSKCVYGIAAYKLGRSYQGYQYFHEVTEFDLFDRKKHTKHGLHLANLGGSYMMLIYGLIGLRMEETLSIEPVDQQEIKSYKVHFSYQGSNLVVDYNYNQMTISTDKPIKLKVYGKVIVVEKTLNFGVKKLTDFQF
jgi:alpha,alpha-trehalose phosphorylase